MPQISLFSYFNQVPLGAQLNMDQASVQNQIQPTHPSQRHIHALRRGDNISEKIKYDLLC